MTVKELREKLELLQDDVEIKIGYGEHIENLNFIVPESNYILFHSELYEDNPEFRWLQTLCFYGKKE